MAFRPLPTVNWRGHEISRLILGHNPIKGHCHRSKKQNRDMWDWFWGGKKEDKKKGDKKKGDKKKGDKKKGDKKKGDKKKGVELLRLCRDQGVNTAQFGRGAFELFPDAMQQGIFLKWIATLYADPKGRFGTGRFPAMTVKEELEQFESVGAPLIGYQHFGEPTDDAYFRGKLRKVRKTIVKLRDWLEKHNAEDRLVGVCTHLPEVVRQIDKEQWPIDFLQTSFYTVYSDMKQKKIDRDNERFDPSDAERMIAAIQDTSFPCIAFKVLGGGRSCETSAQVRESLASALENIKPTDVICVGMWQKYRDQVGENAQYVREILAEQENRVDCRSRNRDQRFV